MNKKYSREKFSESIFLQLLLHLQNDLLKKVTRPFQKFFSKNRIANFFSTRPLNIQRSLKLFRRLCTGPGA